MKNKLRNKDGYRTLKIRLFIVLCLVGLYAEVFMVYHANYYSEIILVPSGIALVIISIILLAAPIHIRYNGYEKSV